MLFLGTHTDLLECPRSGIRFTTFMGCFFQGMLPVIHWTDLHPVCRKRLQIDPNILENTREVCLSTGSGSKLTLKLKLTFDFPEHSPLSQMCRNSRKPEYRFDFSVDFHPFPVDRQTSRVFSSILGSICSLLRQTGCKSVHRHLCVGITPGAYVTNIMPSTVGPRFSDILGGNGFGH
eukprot:sb/3471843/